MNSWLTLFIPWFDKADTLEQEDRVEESARRSIQADNVAEIVTRRAETVASLFSLK